jgi:hypothetical protein
MSRAPVPAVVLPMHHEFHADDKSESTGKAHTSFVSIGRYTGKGVCVCVCAADLRRRANAGEAVSIEVAASGPIVEGCCWFLKAIVPSVMHDEWIFEIMSGWFILRTPR